MISAQTKTGEKVYFNENAIASVVESDEETAVYLINGQKLVFTDSAEHLLSSKPTT